MAAARLSRAAAAVAALLALLLAVVACSSSSTTTVRPSPAPTVTHTVIKVVAPSSPPSMQLPAETAIGTGPQAGEWAAGLLGALGAPVGSPADTASMLAWFAAEDAGHAAGQHTYGAGENNPLNLTAYSASSDGVTGTEPSGAGPGHPGNLDFATPARGVSATAWVIKTMYPAIAAALISGRGLLNNPAVAAALSEWSGTGYNRLG